MRARLLFAMTACAVLVGCNNQPDEQVTGLPSTQPLKATPAPTGPMFGYALTRQGNPSSVPGITVFTIDLDKGTLKQAQALAFKAKDAPSRIAIEPTRKFAYVLSTSGRVDVYSIDPQTGALTASPKDGFAAGASPVALAIAPSGTSLYVADSSSKGAARVYEFTLDPADGSVAPMQPASVAVSVDPTSMTIDPNGRHLYVIDKVAGSIQVFAIDSATGTLKPGGKPSAAGGDPSQLTIDATTKYAYVVSNAGILPFSVGGDGSLKPNGSPIGAADAPRDIDFDPSATTAYVADSKGITTYGFDLANGALKRLRELAVPSTALATCTTTGSKFVYVTASDKATGASTVSALTVDEDTGVLRAVAHATASAGFDSQCLVVASPQ